ncbi:hypothetical protein [Methylocapsa sp. S129]|uniref:hypothetical protein n=1 Tax=Methylocapsa sp. S129 TaxID=1641869 RepID=UPI00131EB0CD|nr:hypothetical protein [Methylocapsa sp. S129]
MLAKAQRGRDRSPRDAAGRDRTFYLAMLSYRFWQHLKQRLEISQICVAINDVSLTIQSKSD